MLSIKTEQLSTQPRLFEGPDLIRFDSLAQSRNYYGDAAEDIACAALGAVRMTIDGRYDVCYDAKKGEDYFEIKSVKQSGECPIWNWRLEKDIKTGLSLFYVFVLHNVRKASDTFELWEGLAETVQEILIVPLPIVKELHATKQTEGNKFKPGTKDFGHYREGYCDGYRRIRITEFKAQLSRIEALEFNVNGYQFNLLSRTLI
ncbi:MAG: hypothetical protein AAFX93_15830 [Verrucomicrobiota bacterium]